ncbi:MAG: plastocyanin/azurin family copper-binding protein [Gemmatimonadaceae bacterium]
MQTKTLALVVSAFALAACGGSGSDAAPAAESTPAATPAAVGTATLAPATGATHEVKMLLTAAGAYVFQPANFTIKSGDAVKFVAVSGFPHNVAFDGVGLSAAVKAQLDANFGSARIAELMSAMYLAEGEGFTLSFANIPPGTYSYNCTPHLAMNMTGVITVQ